MSKNNKKRFHRCCKCDNIAKWFYLPFSDSPRERSFCDEHVPRGCVCNSYFVKYNGLPEEGCKYFWINEKDGIYEYLDEKGRRAPCCEYYYEEDGLERIELDKYIKRNDILEIWDKLYAYAPKSPSYPSLIKYIESIEKGNEEEIEYNPFMQTIRNLCTPYWRYLILDKSKNIIHFYNSFREQCNRKSYLR